MSIIDAAAREAIIPFRTSNNGRRSRERLVRAAMIYAGFAAAGSLPLLFNLAPGLQALGLGLWLPGGGFAALGGWGYLGFAATVLLFVLGLVVWFATGAMALPMGIWGLTAIWAGLLARAPAGAAARIVVPALAVLTIAGYVAGSRRADRRQLAVRAVRNQYLPQALQDLAQRAARAPADAPAARELTPEQIAAVRYLLDRALQPVPAFEGFDVIDQFQTAALRYQITFSQFALALMQRHYTPRFHGYLSEAQRNLIDKMTDKKVWGYWVLESLWGNLSTDFDPASRDNIMLGGFYNTNVSLYTANTGDERYLRPGSMTFRLNGKTAYRHDARTLAQAALKNFRATSLCLYPCEPHFSYSFCNLVGFNGLPVNDRLFGTKTFDEIYPDFRSAFEEDFMRLDGEVHAGRMRPTGLALPRFTGLFMEGSLAWISTPFFPDIARRSWAILRQDAVSYDAAGEIKLALRATDGMDSGNYRKSDVAAYAHALLAARELGDAEIAEALQKRIDRVFERTISDGVLCYPRTSTYYHAFLVMARLVQQGDWAAMIMQEPQVPVGAGPLLAGCAYPDVLVAKAYSTGEDLALVLYPGRAAGVQGLKLERLRPGQRYAMAPQGESFIADSAGAAHIEVLLEGRTEVNITPAGR